MTETEANIVYDLLVEHAGATDAPDKREHFVWAQARKYLSEWRFIGSLGFGGKFRRDRTGEGEQWRVDCYPEDLTPERQEAIEATNNALAQLQRSA